MNKITVYRSTEKKTPLSKKNISISFQELRSWISSRKIYFHLFRYRESRMVTDDLRWIPKPFALALLMRILAKTKAVWEDQRGIVQEINCSLLFSLFINLMKDFFLKKNLLRKIEDQIAFLSASFPSIETKHFDITQSPVYLRTDLCFGLQSGGSIGHIAGVLNHLNHFTGNPIFLTTDHIPTVSQEWECHIVAPENAFWDFSELPPLYFNEFFLKQAIQRIGTRQPSFIYQRYSTYNFSGIQLAKYYRVPFVLEFNGSEVWVHRHWGGHALKYEPLAKQIEMLNLKASDLVVVVSQPLKDELIAKGIDPKKVLVNPNGVDPDTYSPDIDGTSVRQKQQLKNKIVLGFIGTFGKWHGAEILAEAFGNLMQSFPELKKEIRLLMIGDGVTMPLVKQTLSKWNVDQDTILTGTVPQELGPLYLAACDILVAPHIPNADGSPFFGSPTKLFEYMAMGKGIVASDLNQIGEILEHNRTAWMVKPGDAASLMRGLKALIDDHSTRIRLGQAAREKVVSHHSWKEHTRKIIDSLCRLI